MYEASSSQSKQVYSRSSQYLRTCCNIRLPESFTTLFIFIWNSVPITWNLSFCEIYGLKSVKWKIYFFKLNALGLILSYNDIFQCGLCVQIFNATLPVVISVYFQTWHHFLFLLSSMFPPVHYKVQQVFCAVVVLTNQET